mmetsp:Transcript_57188/g.66864  ORF Transcript_57188/g.66864 Transcript_57188/m.66864 type:complete len:614 (-) Transcript_57188:121-1962(-)|eukprot:CAMPEP_0194378222 /NCGR_PEP_ID=MMETSP0174-20130528/34452_1 /TAXON_ID=216777 /ORGANISM="Proboscia alata, Strain PI-D3" /LENGTH=613 /DNA_ID=CAMNT_0039160071 /DNA_START=45 /DNA_END=1886 /DNA_ORIENTATION=-
MMSSHRLAGLLKSNASRLSRSNTSILAYSASTTASHSTPEFLATRKFTYTSPSFSPIRARFFSQQSQPYSSLTEADFAEFGLGTSKTITSIDATALKSNSPNFSPQLTKIVATIGPTSEQQPVMQELVDAGFRIMRLNFSHATTEEVELRCTNLMNSDGRHEAVPDRGSKNLRAVLLDTKGPEIRTGKLRNDTSGKETVTLVAGEKITIRTTSNWAEGGSTASDMFVDYKELSKCLEPGMKVLLDDGAVILKVLEIPNGDDVICEIENTSDIRSRAGVNLPGAATVLPAMSDKDRVDIKYGLTKDIDYIAISFVQDAEGVDAVRKYVRDVMNELGFDPEYPAPLLISKIESVRGLQNFGEILEASDGIMVARGDLGVEIPIHQIANAQKEMVSACNAVGKPVVVATQMLESMTKNPRPTRAEVADVTNAVYDGADAVMLSGETAKGKYPVESVKTMNDIIHSSEQFTISRPDLSNSARFHSSLFTGRRSEKAGSAITAVAKAAVAAAQERHVTAIIVVTEKGSLPKMVSAFRPNVPIVAVVPNAKVGRQLQIFRGVHPVIGVAGISPHKRPLAAIRDAKALGFIAPGNDIIILTGEANEESNDCVTMRVATVK